ncbi:MAG: phospholipase D-like domain-containing protein [Dehalococcoidia bacterium]|nr:phospholipase D-like domain-containing protein [Dehalococcoidia bacterium]
MQVEVIDNSSRDLASLLLPSIEESQEVRIAVAFLSRRGLSAIRSSAQGSLERGASLEFLVGLDLSVTEPAAVRDLYQMCRANERMSLYCYADLGPSVTYHPKLYLMRKGEEITAVIGSSNLTQGGLRRNIELNVVLRANVREEIAADVYSAYNRLKFDKRRAEPDEEFIELYREIYERQRRLRQAGAREAGSRELMARFRGKAQTLRRPIPTVDDLVGWLKLVYDHVPDGDFTNEDLYRLDATFQAYYPDNQNVRPKIRQKLQELRDMGLIEHLARSRWRKVR